MGQQLLKLTNSEIKMRVLVEKMSADLQLKWKRENVYTGIQRKLKNGEPIPEFSVFSLPFP